MVKVASLFLASMAFLAAHSLAADADADFKNEVLTLHREYRARYGANPLTWSDDLYPATLEWANACSPQHSQPKSQYGEVMYSGDESYVTFAKGMEAWMDEASRYDYINPGFSGATGEFTQVVWKATTQVACAMVSCPARRKFRDALKNIVCHYYPPGNIYNQFRDNVGYPVQEAAQP
ncbi:hypothetical protein DFQ27_006612 [Actinomortierella ambigua]|uniref:SCP domain-containing protein n=1 Tax=Actinomortierella ambigua TaxID=1343610 RepID=A0A9P6PYH4_9FUNG|nr:hypothetical protein DFQ27_006612 [Actinomortierella ambigua]